MLTALTMPAVAAPYSASNWFVTTWNSWIDSSGGRACAPELPPRKSSLLLPPSIRYTTPLPFWPLIVTLSDEESAAAL